MCISSLYFMPKVKVFYRDITLFFLLKVNYLFLKALFAISKFYCLNLFLLLTLNTHKVSYLEFISHLATYYLYCIQRKYISEEFQGLMYSLQQKCCLCDKDTTATTLATEVYHNFLKVGSSSEILHSAYSTSI